MKVPWSSRKPWTVPLASAEVAHDLAAGIDVKGVGGEWEPGGSIVVKTPLSSRKPCSVTPGYIKAPTIWPGSVNPESPSARGARNVDRGEGKCGRRPKEWPRE